MQNHGNDRSKVLNSIADAFNRKYGDSIRSTLIHNGNPDYNELEVEVGDEDKDTVAKLAVEDMASFARERIRGHPPDRFGVTVVPNGQRGAEFVYTVYVRESLVDDE